MMSKSVTLPTFMNCTVELLFESFWCCFDQLAKHGSQQGGLACGLGLERRARQAVWRVFHPNLQGASQDEQPVLGHPELPLIQICDLMSRHGRYMII